MLCSSCRRQVSRESSWCSSCGAPIGETGAPLELVLADATRVPLTGELVIGRAPGNTLQIADPSGPGRSAGSWLRSGADAMIKASASSHGTSLDGHRVPGAEPLRDG